MVCSLGEVIDRAHWLAYQLMQQFGMPQGKSMVLDVHSLRPCSVELADLDSHGGTTRRFLLVPAGGAADDPQLGLDLCRAVLGPLGLFPDRGLVGFQLYVGPMGETPYLTVVHQAMPPAEDVLGVLHQHGVTLQLQEAAADVAVAG